MSLLDFVKRVLLPFGIALQVAGYAESFHRLVGIPAPFLFATSGFLLTIACLVWLVWFSPFGAYESIKKIGLGAILALSVGYYSLVEYQIMTMTVRSNVNAIIAIDSARYVSLQFPAEAVQRIDAVVKMLPDVPEVYNIRGVAFWRLHQYREALRDFETASGLDPANSQYLYNQASIFRSMCDFTGAKKILDKFTDQFKSNMSGRYDRGVVYQVLGHNDAALDDYNVVIASREDPPMQSAIFNSAVIYAAIAVSVGEGADRNRALARMFSLLDQAIKLNPTGRPLIIRAALVPIERREPLCGGKYYVTDNLTDVGQLPQFKQWYQGYQ